MLRRASWLYKKWKTCEFDFLNNQLCVTDLPIHCELTLQHKQNHIQQQQQQQHLQAYLQPQPANHPKQQFTGIEHEIHAHHTPSRRIELSKSWRCAASPSIIPPASTVTSQCFAGKASGRASVSLVCLFQSGGVTFLPGRRRRRRRWKRWMVRIMLEEELEDEALRWRTWVSSSCSRVVVKIVRSLQHPVRRSSAVKPPTPVREKPNKQR